MCPIQRPVGLVCSDTEYGENTRGNIPDFQIYPNEGYDGQVAILTGSAIVEYTEQTKREIVFGLDDNRSIQKNEI